MRVIYEKNYPQQSCKLSVYQWNGKFLIKVESAFLEQTFKVDQTDVSSLEQLLLKINEKFIEKACLNFDHMADLMSEVGLR